jgi:peptide/nickel transport system permease protein
VLKFILRRLGSSFLVLLGASLLLYVLTINSGDPLRDLRESNAENREFLIEQRKSFMGLDEPWYTRYGDWLLGVGKCFIGQCDLGTNRSGQQVTDLLGLAAASTLRLVLLATVLAMVFGVLIGILTAIRQYSGMDYAVTFSTFLFFSLPVFWAAVLLKEYLAIGFNDWIADPGFTWPAVIVLGLVLGLALQAILGGSTRRRMLTFLVTFAFTCVAIPYLTWLNFAQYPQLGPVAITLIGVAAAVGATALGAGLKNRRVLYAGLVTAALGLVAYYATYSLLWDPNWLIIIVLGGVAVGVAVLVGRLMGGYSKGAATWVSIFTAVIMGGLILTEHVFRAWPSYLDIVGRPIATIGSQTPNFTGTFWEDLLDKGTQLLLPTILLALVSIATYSRYTRASMLEVGQQDYIRTARAKGLNERQVILKHAFRNSLIPITTIMAFDFAGLIGGAVITEQVFGWKGMGELFRTGLMDVDPAPVMAFFLITGTAAVLFNLLADILYAVLDPRIRV